MNAGLLVEQKAMDSLCARLAAAEKALANVEHPEQKLCTGPFIGCTGRTGWWDGWSDVFSAQNVDTTTSEWIQIGNAWTGPNCVHDVAANVDMGNHYVLMRRMRSYLWLDVRLLRNGVACRTETYDTYTYQDETQDTNPDVITPVQYLLSKPGGSNLCCTNSAPGTVYTVEVRTRYRAVSSQSSSYFRYIGGLRSEGQFITTPRNIVEGRV